jgi:uncharacterized protein YxjI
MILTKKIPMTAQRKTWMIPTTMAGRNWSMNGDISSQIFQNAMATMIQMQIDSRKPNEKQDMGEPS